jgi:hypothetical protein
MRLQVQLIHHDDFDERNDFRRLLVTDIRPNVNKYCPFRDTNTRLAPELMMGC